MNGKYLCFLTIGYWREGNHSTFSIHQAWVVVFAIQQLQVPATRNKAARSERLRQQLDTMAGDSDKKELAWDPCTSSEQHRAGPRAALQPIRYFAGFTSSLIHVAHSMCTTHTSFLSTSPMSAVLNRSVPSPAQSPKCAWGKPQQGTDLCSPETFWRFFCFRCSSASSCSWRRRSFALISFRPRGMICTTQENKTFEFNFTQTPGL